jgi:hypothetical protein
MSTVPFWVILRWQRGGGRNAGDAAGHLVHGTRGERPSRDRPRPSPGAPGPAPTQQNARNTGGRRASRNAGPGQLAKLRGCRIIGSAGSVEKMRFLREECASDRQVVGRIPPINSGYTPIACLTFLA